MAIPKGSVFEMGRRMPPPLLRWGLPGDETQAPSSLPQTRVPRGAGLAFSLPSQTGVSLLIWFMHLPSPQTEEIQGLSLPFLLQDGGSLRTDPGTPPQLLQLAVDLQNFSVPILCSSPHSQGLSSLPRSGAWEELPLAPGWTPGLEDRPFLWNHEAQRPPRVLPLTS